MNTLTNPRTRIAVIGLTLLACGCGEGEGTGTAGPIPKAETPAQLSAGQATTPAPDAAKTAH